MVPRSSLFHLPSPLGRFGVNMTTHKFALDVLTDTLEAMRADGFIPENDEFSDCDWEEADCPSCGRDQGLHTSRQMTRCATTRRIP